MTPSQLTDALQFFFANKFPVLIKGKPGIGKTDLVAAAAAAANAELIISHPVVSDPTDFKGLPFAANGEADFLLFGDLRKLIEATVLTVFFIDDIGRNDYSFSRPNRRYLHTGFILPSLYNIEIGSIVLIVDTSASMDEELLNLVAAEMHDIAAVFNTIIEVIYVDTKVAGSQTIEPNDVFKLEPKGGGGTDFRPAFPYMEENSINPAVTVYFTDGECNRFPETEPDAPLLWAIYDNDSFKPPFGEVLYVDKN